MSDDLPTEDRLQRIERGVQRRIDARRATAQRIARGVSGCAVAALVIAGGFALLRPFGGIAASTSGSGGDSAAEASSSAMVEVVCHEGGAPRVVEADRTRLPASAVQACVGRRAAAQPDDASGSSASATPPATALCRAKDGVLHVYPGATRVCATHGMRAYGG